jgi:hypothetical protein
MLTATDIDRFWIKVEKSESACWLWTAFTDKFGYGKFGLDGGSVLAHRVAWRLASYEDPGSWAVLHTCDIPSCVRNDDAGLYHVEGIAYPRWGHLYLATRPVNNRDMAQKGRRKGKASVVGSKVGTSVLVDADVVAIRAMLDTGRWSQDEIADLFRMTQANVSSIALRKSWTHI